MPSFKHGLDRGVDTVVVGLIGGVIVGGVVPIFVDYGLLPAGVFKGLVALSIISVVMTIEASRYWSFSYLTGFVIGVFLTLPILSHTEYIGPTDWLLFGGAAIGAVALRVKIHRSYF